MIKEEIELFDYYQDESMKHLEDDLPSTENQVHLSEETQMEGTVLEMTSVLSFIQKTKDVATKVEKYPKHSFLRTFTLTCYVSSFCIAVIGLIFLFLQG